MCVRVVLVASVINVESVIVYQIHIHLKEISKDNTKYLVFIAKLIIDNEHLHGITYDKLHYELI